MEKLVQCQAIERHLLSMATRSMASQDRPMLSLQLVLAEEKSLVRVMNALYIVLVQSMSHDD